MAKGRKPDPAAVKVAKGNPGRRPIVHAPADQAGVVATAPKVLQAAARKIWDSMAPELTRLKFLRSTDFNAFARYCQHLSDFWRYTRDLRREGDTYLSKSEHNPEGMLRVNPKFILRERVEKRLEALEDRFGLSPASRQQILQRLAGALPAQPAGGLFDQTADGGAEEAQAPTGSPIGMLSRPGSVH